MGRKRDSGAAVPSSRPLRALTREGLLERFEHALTQRDGLTGAHCVHELWMRGELSLNIEAMLERLWSAARETVPDWLPMRHIAWLPLAYEVAGRFVAEGRGRSNIYLVLLDYSDSRSEPHGVYVGATRYSVCP